MNSYQAVLALAAEADIDPRTAKKVIEGGAEVVRGRLRERIAAAAAKLGIALGRAS